MHANHGVDILEPISANRKNVVTDDIEAKLKAFLDDFVKTFASEFGAFGQNVRM